jgi:hypothetical protein
MCKISERVTTSSAPSELLYGTAIQFRKALSTIASMTVPGEPYIQEKMHEKLYKTVKVNDYNLYLICHKDIRPFSMQ